MKEKEVPRIIRLKETTSTNNYLREYIQHERLPEGSVVVSEFQTGGRGQTGNSWESAPGKNLLFSVVLYPDVIQANQQFIISEIATLAVKETLDYYTDHISIKWPNDIYWKDKKICGMLIENDLTGPTIYCSVIGIGINLNQSAFIGGAVNPVSLRQITGKEYDIEEVLNRFLHIFYDYYLLLLQEKSGQIHVSYLASLYRRDNFYPYSDENGEFNARIHDIEPTGHMVLETENGDLRRYAFKEVSYLI